MHLASGDIPVTRSRLSEGVAGVDETVAKMVEMAKGQFGARSAKIRALAINILNQANVPNKDYYGSIIAIGEWVRDNIRYVKDPIGQETLSYPEETAFNSLAGDCDDSSILVMGLLGSIGIRSWPVVVGLVPGLFSHVYVYAEVPRGKHRHANETIAIDAIMRDWPIGKEVPGDKVKAKKIYTNLAGLGAMPLGAYATAPSYLDEGQSKSVPAALRSRITDAGGYGQDETTASVQAGDEGMDSLFTQVPAGEDRLYSRGPVSAADASGTVDMLGKGRRIRREEIILRARRRGNFRKVDGSEMFDRPFMVTDAQPAVANDSGKDNAPMSKTVTPNEVRAIAGYIAGLEAEIDAKGAGFAEGILPGDPLFRACSALHLAEKRARDAAEQAQEVRAGAGNAMFAGLSGPDAAATAAAVQGTQQTAQAMNAVTAKAAQVAAKAVGESPARQQQAVLAKQVMEAGDRQANLTAMIEAAGGDDDDQLDSFAVKALTLSTMTRALVGQAAKACRMPVDFPLPTQTVITDHLGRPVSPATGLAGGLGAFKLPSFARPIAKRVQQVTASVKQMLKSPPKQAFKIFHDEIRKNIGKDALTALSFGAYAAVKGAGGGKGLAKIFRRKKSAKEGGGEEITYLDQNGKPITKEEYDRLMGGQGNIVYLDEYGNVITQAQYNAIMYGGAQPLPTSTGQPLPTYPGGPLPAPYDPSLNPPMYQQIPAQQPQVMIPATSYYPQQQQMYQPTYQPAQSYYPTPPGSSGDAFGPAGTPAPPVDTFGPEDMSAPYESSWGGPGMDAGAGPASSGTGPLIDDGGASAADMAAEGTLYQQASPQSQGGGLDALLADLIRSSEQTAGSIYARLAQAGPNDLAAVSAQFPLTAAAIDEWAYNAGQSPIFGGGGGMNGLGSFSVAGVGIGTLAVLGIGAYFLFRNRAAA